MGQMAGLVYKGEFSPASYEICIRKSDEISSLSTDRAYVVQGHYPSALLSAWDTYGAAAQNAENPRPGEEGRIMMVNS